jgi:molybdopterin-guanine dinucleotide biosynthesis protein A
MQRMDEPRVDKALLRFNGETLLERALRVVMEVCGNAAILGGPADRCERLAAYGRVVPDSIVACGPLAGLSAALHDAGEEWLLLVPVDVPLLPASALRQLVEAATENGKPCVACFDGVDHRQPLPVALHRSARRVVDAALDRGERRLMPVLRETAAELSPLGMTVVPVDELFDEMDASVMFTNVNTPEDLRAAEELAMLSNDFARRASE